MTRSFFITGTGTGIGKTLITAGLCHQLTQGGYRVGTCKPVVSGFSYDDTHSDPAVILRSLGRPVTREQINTLSPWRYRAALSPHMAAWAEGRAPGAAEVVEACRQAAQDVDVALAEGAGGIMCPVNDHETMLDVCAALGWPVVLVAGTYLGALSHTLTALSALDARGIALRAVVLSESEEGAVALADTEKSIRMFAPTDSALYTVPRLPVQEDLWKHLPDLTALCLSSG